MSETLWINRCRSCAQVQPIVWYSVFVCLFVFFPLPLQIEFLLYSGSVRDAGYGMANKRGRVFVSGQLF